MRRAAEEREKQWRMVKDRQEIEERQRRVRMNDMKGYIAQQPHAQQVAYWEAYLNGSSGLRAIGN